jgi:hypothetical protein
MKFPTTFSTLFFFMLLVFSACKKDQSKSMTESMDSSPLKTLNSKEKETVDKFERASWVLQGLFSSNPQLRKEFNGFIAAKLAKTGTDEDLSFKEIFNARNITLAGVKPDFLIRFRDAFVGTFVSGRYPNSSKYSNNAFTNMEQVAAYYDIKTVINNSSIGSSGTSSVYNSSPDGIPYMIYFPYSENWPSQSDMGYAVSYHPLTTDEWNYGKSYDASGNLLPDVIVNDEYAYEHPTYILTYDDGLTLDDFSNGNMPIEAENYRVTFTDEQYNSIVLQNQVADPNPSPCLSTLYVKDGRWTLLNNAYGIFENRIEFGVAVSRDISDVTIPNQHPQSNPIIQIDRKAQAWGYVRIKRNKVRRMQDSKNEYVSIGISVGPWCPGQPDKMMFLYEYDKPNMFSRNALEWSNLLTAGVGLVGDSATRSTLSSLASSGVAPLVKVLLEGTADSRIEHYGIIGSNAVWAGLRVPTNGMDPSLLNGFRPYGKNSVMVTLVID